MALRDFGKCSYCNDNIYDFQETEIADGNKYHKGCYEINKGGHKVEKIFKISWDDDLGQDWMNVWNLELCLFSEEHITSHGVSARGKVTVEEVKPEIEPPIWKEREDRVGKFNIIAP